MIVPENQETYNYCGQYFGWESGLDQMQMQMEEGYQAEVQYGFECFGIVAVDAQEYELEAAKQVLVREGQGQLDLMAYRYWRCGIHSPL